MSAARKIRNMEEYLTEVTEPYTNEIHGLKINNFKDCYNSKRILRSLENMAKIIKYECKAGDEHVEVFINIDKRPVDNRAEKRKFYIYLRNGEIEYGIFDSEAGKISHEIEYEELYNLTSEKIMELTDKTKSVIRQYNADGYSYLCYAAFNEIKKEENFVADSVKLAEEMYKDIMNNPTDPRLRNKDIMDILTALKDKDSTTFIHSVRVAEYTKKICQSLGFNQDQLNDIYLAGILHDCGKIEIPDEILNKNGELTNDEREIINSHSWVGQKKIINLMKKEELKRLDMALMMTKYHHTNQIDDAYKKVVASHPDYKTVLEVAAICDQYDALTERRQYKGYKHIDEVMLMLEENANKGQLSVETLQQIADVLYDISWDNEKRIEKTIKREAMPGVEQQKSDKTYLNEKTRRMQMAKVVLERMKKPSNGPRQNQPRL